MPDILAVRRTSPGFTCIGIPPWILGQKRVNRVGFVLETAMLYTEENKSNRKKGGECGY